MQIKMWEILKTSVVFHFACWIKSNFGTHFSTHLMPLSILFTIYAGHPGLFILWNAKSFAIWGPVPFILPRMPFRLLSPLPPSTLHIVFFKEQLKCPFLSQVSLTIYCKSGPSMFFFVSKLCLFSPNLGYIYSYPPPPSNINLCSGW